MQDTMIDIIKSTKGVIFSVLFIKKDGSERHMNCRLGVKKHLNGGKLGFDALSKGLVPVYDLVKKDYRMINLSTIKYIKFNGRTYTKWTRNL